MEIGRRLPAGDTRSFRIAVNVLPAELYGETFHSEVLKNWSWIVHRQSAINNKLAHKNLP